MVRAHPLHRSEREREGEKGERCRIYPELLFLFLKGMTGALAPLSYLVIYRSFVNIGSAFFNSG